MNAKNLMMALGGALIGVGMLWGCGSSSQSDAASIDASAQPEVSSLGIAFDIKSASRTYQIAGNDAGETYFLTLSSNVQWPQKVGDLNLAPLQDTIQQYLYGRIDKDGIDAAICRFVSDTDVYGLGNSVSVIDTIPAGMMGFYNKADAELVEVSGELVTVNVDLEQFMGGAHPMYKSYPFTFDFDINRVITNNWLFQPGSKAELRTLIKADIARQLSMSEDELDMTLFDPNFEVSDLVYIEDGQIIFHFNRYDILPYAMGAIDVALAPWDVRDLLTPAAAKLLSLPE